MIKLVDVTKLSHHNRISLLLNKGKRHIPPPRIKESPIIPYVCKHLTISSYINLTFI